MAQRPRSSPPARRAPGLPPRAPGGGSDRLLRLLRPGNVRMGAVIVIAALAFFGLLPPGEIRGPVEIVDGDTVVVDGTERIRLYGIDAPELDQPCRDGGPCGRRAKDHLATLVGTKMLSCDKRGDDRYGRDVAQCYVIETGTDAAGQRGIDVGRAMVRDGHAMAYREITTLYAADEPARFGFAPPWEWREQHGRERMR